MKSALESAKFKSLFRIKYVQWFICIFAKSANHSAHIVVNCQTKQETDESHFLILQPQNLGQYELAGIVSL